MSREVFMSNKWFPAVTICWMIMLAVCPAQASDIAVFQGKISLQNNLPVPDVELILIHETMGEKNIKVKQDGSFKARLFDLGRYSVKLASPGFLIYSVKFQQLNVLGSIEAAQQTILDETQKIPDLQASSDRTYIYEFTLVAADFFENKSQQEELGRAQKYILEAEEKINAQKPEEAIPLLDKAISIKADIAYTYYLMGVAFFNMQDHRTAIKHFEKSLDVKPDIENAHYYLGKIAFDSKELEEAIRHFEAELKISPNQPPVLESLGVVYRETGNREKAAEIFERLRRLRPADERVLAELLALYTGMGDEAKIKEIAASQESLGQQDASTYYNLGTSYWNEKNYSSAAEAFRKALDKDPGLSPAHKALGYCLIQLKDEKQALVHLKKYLELNPSADDQSKIKGIIQEIEE